MRVFIFLCFLLLVGCDKKKISKSLLQPNSEWTFSRKDFNNPNKEVSAILTFNKNGYAYEKNTILFYKWSVQNDILYLDNQEFEILRVDKNRIDLRNVKYGNTAQLINNQIFK